MVDDSNIFRKKNIDTRKTNVKAKTFEHCNICVNVDYDYKIFFRTNAKLIMSFL